MHWIMEKIFLLTIKYFFFLCDNQRRDEVSVAEENLSNKFHFRPPPVTAARGAMLGTWSEELRILNRSDSYNGSYRYEILRNMMIMMIVDCQLSWGWRQIFCLKSCLSIDNVFDV